MIIVCNSICQPLGLQQQQATAKLAAATINDAIKLGSRSCRKRPRETSKGRASHRSQPGPCTAAPALCIHLCIDIALVGDHAGVDAAWQVLRQSTAGELSQCRRAGHKRLYRHLPRHYMGVKGQGVRKHQQGAAALQLHIQEPQHLLAGVLHCSP